jgi:acetyl esterase/lipase
MRLPFHSAILLLAILAGFQGRAAAQQQPAPLEPTHADVRYGRFDRNVLDVYQADTREPAPVLIYFHGGGWVGGDKKPVQALPFVRNGVTVIAANYRFTTGHEDAAPYPAPMEDGARVVQFVRSKAKEWNIDPDRIALTGGSAGAVISMWIAYRDDMAEPDSQDPVERFSTRVTCIVPIAGPTTLDPDLILKRVGGNPQIHPALLPFYDVASIDELRNDPAKRKLVADASPITHVSADDPPTFMGYGFPLGGTPLPPDADFNLSIHHPEFGVILKEKLDEVGVENVLQSKDDGSDPQAMVAFLRKHLKPEPPIPAPAGG